MSNAPIPIGDATFVYARGRGAQGCARQHRVEGAARCAPRCTPTSPRRRSATLWALDEATRRPVADVLRIAGDAGFDLSGQSDRLTARATSPTRPPAVRGGDVHHAVVIVGGGAAGISLAASLRRRRHDMDIAIVEPADIHYYQPGWTMVGAGVFESASTARPMASLIPSGVRWIQDAAAGLEPERNAVTLASGRSVRYDRLVVCPGLELDWDRVEGLSDALGANGVTSNYRFDLAPYTWDCVRALKTGRAVFTQPPMPIKCAGAPQKAMYLSADHWRRTGALADIDIHFRNAGGVLFGVQEYVPALERYIERYGIAKDFHSNLVAVDGGARKAWFDVKLPDAPECREEVDFDLLHVCPPQVAPDFVAESPLADGAGWVDVDPGTLRHARFENVWGLGDATNTTNAKTAAAVRKQVPVVADNLVADLVGDAPLAFYDGYGSCPLTVERGRIVLAEFTYGGKVAPSFPRWMNDGTRPTRAAWMLKEQVLPPLYWHAMLRGREWLTAPAT